MQLKDYLRESHLFTERAIVAGILVAALLIGIAVRLYVLQVQDHGHYQTLSRDNRVKVVPLPPTRGLIEDRNGVLLALNRPTFSLEIVPEQVADMAQTLSDLAQMLPIDAEDLDRFQELRRHSRRFKSIPIRLDLTEDEAAIFAVNRHRFPGVDIQARLTRHYPEASQAAHVVGYVGRISEQDLDLIDESTYAGTSHIGKIGVEKTYESTLHGEVGVQRVEVNVLGRVIRVLEQSQPQPGHNLRLHLDVRLQQVAMRAFGEHNGALVAIDPETGGVLALVSKPGFDPNRFVEGISPKAYRALQQDEDKPLYNRALRGQYPPGSTLKPFIALGGLETGIISFDTTRFCPGFYRLPGRSHRYRDWKKWGHGNVALDAAITESCDVFFYQLAHDMGIDGMHAYLGDFGFGAPTGIDLVGEASGLLPSKDWKRRARNQPWYPGETLIVGIGQGYFLSTPLQLAAATAAIANGGSYRAPRVVAEIRGADDQVVARPRTRSRDLSVIDPQHWDDVHNAMANVVEGLRGTAKRIRSDDYRIAGKTGTAQVFTVKQDEEYDEEEIDEKLRDHALFVAYAPLEAPSIAIAVVVENGGHGGATAAPIARRVMDAYLLGDYNVDEPETPPDPDAPITADAT